MASLKRERLYDKPEPAPYKKLQPVGRDKRTAKQIREWAYRSGMVPQVFLLNIMRGEKVGDHKPTFKERMEAARMCISYFAPQMKSIEVTDTTPPQEPTVVLNEAALAKLTDDEVELFGRVLAKLDPNAKPIRTREEKEEIKRTFESSLYH